jgi:hypothetical protein
MKSQGIVMNDLMLCHQTVSKKEQGKKTHDIGHVITPISYLLSSMKFKENNLDVKHKKEN